MKNLITTITALTTIISTNLLSSASLAQQASIAQSSHPYVLVDNELSTGEPWELHLVLTTDEIYVPIGVRKPEGNGPFPVILIGSGQGVDGMGKIERSMARFRELMGRLVDRGYVAAFVSYRNEVPDLYNEIEQAYLLDDTVSGGNRTLRSAAALDSDDHVSIIEHAKSLPYTNPDAIGAIGSSHSGEIIMKTLTRGDNYLAAAVPAEAAVTEYLAVDRDNAPRDEAGTGLELLDTATVKRLADKDRAMARLREVGTPLLILGRDEDHLQGLFRLLYEWGEEAGANVIWQSFDHPVHGYALMGRAADETFESDPIEEQVFELYMEFLDEHLK